MPVADKTGETFEKRVIGLIIILEYDVIPFKTLGFQCKDPILSHKFRGDTIPFGYLLAASIVGPLITMLIVECFVLKSTFLYLIPTKKGRLKLALYWYGQFLLGFLILLFLTQLTKSLIAEPRPHFFDTCKPDKGLNCTSGYIFEYKCTNKNLPERTVRDSFKSFPSGHSALGIYTAIVLSWYLQNRLPSSELLLVPWLQCIFLSWGLICALSRITDHRHHWWDVLAGSILGALLALLTVKVFCEDFRFCKSLRPDKNLNETKNTIDYGSNKKFLSSATSNYNQSENRELPEIK